MTKSLPLMIMTAGALISGAAGAATRTTPTPAKTVATKRVVATTTTHAATPGARMVSTRTATGKAVTYNCAKAGNATKKACR